MSNNTFNRLDANSIDQWINSAANGNASAPVAMTAMTNAALGQVMAKTKHVMETLVGYKELMMMYNCAIKEIQTKFDVLNSEFKIRYKRNPISSIQTRLKSTSSILEKMRRQKVPMNLESLEENVNDVAGVRVICSYIDDIYKIAESLLKQDDITLISRKDYIAQPKENGYRSLHLVVQVPVFFSEQKRSMKVEVQIRTIAMDFWASLEHQLKYKQDIPDQEEIVKRLKACAEASNATDIEMLNIRREIEAMTDSPTEEDILFDKFSRMDMAFE